MPIAAESRYPTHSSAASGHQTFSSSCLPIALILDTKSVNIKSTLIVTEYPQIGSQCCGWLRGRKLVTILNVANTDCISAQGESLVSGIWSPLLTDMFVPSSLGRMVSSISSISLGWKNRRQAYAKLKNQSTSVLKGKSKD